MEGNTRWEIGFDRACNHIHRRALCRHDQMNAARPRHLCKALNASFDLFACNHHQIGHFVHDHDNERHDLGLELFGFEDGLTRILVKARLDSALEHFAFGQSIAHAAIIAFDIAHPHFRHFAITLFHLTHDPFQSDNRLLGVSHNGAEKMRNAVINRQFQHLGVNHDHATFFRAQFIQQREDHGVNRHRFPRACGARNQQMRHLGEIGHNRFAADFLTQSQRQLVIAIAKIAARQDFAQNHLFAVQIGQFDADHRATWNG